MNPQEPIVPDPDSPVESPTDPVEEPPTADGIESYRVSA
jgi:hypothetical protein